MNLWLEKMNLQFEALSLPLQKMGFMIHNCRKEFATIYYTPYILYTWTRGGCTHWVLAARATKAAARATEVLWWYLGGFGCILDRQDLPIFFPGKGSSGN